MTYKLHNVEKLVKNKDYNKIRLYMKQYSNYSYSFITYLTFMKNKYHIIELEDIINDFFSNNNTINKKNSIIRNDYTYKEDVKTLFNNKCGVTGDNLCNEVAHIFEFKDCNYDVDKYDKCNGIYLKDSIHNLWDNNYLLINYCKQRKIIYFTININKLYDELNNNLYKTTIINYVNEIFRTCGIYNTITELNNSEHTINHELIKNIEIPININKDYFENYKYYINKRYNN